MFNSRYSKLLTVVLVLVIIGIIGTVGYFVYDMYVVKAKNNKAKEIVDQFSEGSVRREFDKDEKGETGPADNPLDAIGTIENNQATGEKIYMEGYEVMGTIEIPKTKVNLPVLSEVTKKSLETSVAILYGVGLNQPGNTTIVGHNYRRTGVFFSDNKKLFKGDVVYITDQTGTRVTYEIYDIFQADTTYADYMVRDTENKREISLSTCTDSDPNARLVILAKEK